MIRFFSKLNTELNSIIVAIIIYNNDYSMEPELIIEIL